ncbi:hypothetical protein J6590_082866 [Homalodisca vitripennis]|nr:hypothetical protein J6590_082866 [Homalodisca vitripennis]
MEVTAVYLGLTPFLAVFVFGVFHSRHRRLLQIEPASVKLGEGNITRFPHPPQAHQVAQQSIANSKSTRN